MRIFSKKTFRFEKEGEKTVEVFAGAFSPDLPDWIAGTKLFKLAQKDGSIKVMANKNDAADFEKELINNELAALREQAKTLGIKNTANMRQSTLETRIAEMLKKQDNGKDNGENDGDSEETDPDDTDGDGKDKESGGDDE
jgi:hypothetical protein